MNNLRQAVIISIALGLLLGCSEPAKEPVLNPDDRPIEAESANQPSLRSVDFSAAADYFSSTARTSVNTMLAHCSQMQAAVENFVNTPSDSAQQQAQLEYQSCYLSWQRAQVYFQLPFNLSEQKSFVRMVDLIDTRPFVLGYIDGIPEYPFSGLVNELGLDISAANLRGQHRLMDEESASLGFPVLEFFLWRQPIDGVWLVSNAEHDSNAVERRLEYLRIATSMQIDQLTDATMRWQKDGAFDKLPEHAQLSYVLKSLQRLTMVNLLANRFEDVVLKEPDWYHPAIISGNGLAYPLAHLDSLQQLLGDTESETEFSQWVDKLIDAPASSEHLKTVLAQGISAVSQLSPNYPFDSADNERWQLARQSIADLALKLSNLSIHLDVSILTK